MLNQKTNLKWVIVMICIDYDIPRNHDPVLILDLGYTARLETLYNIETSPFGLSAFNEDIPDTALHGTRLERWNGSIDKKD